MQITNVINAIDKNSEQTPDRIAYDYLGETHTYHELKCYSDALASKMVLRQLLLVNKILEF
ncbi:Hypothetical protein ADU72_1811 [Pediococcus damnosus]|uniref:Uncharacterized protein n=1 Tax=Pediococcus damnosus TaxID=51663 RepID=A0ABM6A5V1_9LACO|nr:hypothetical protein [Pediococcus damnosus]AMV67736.1 Hypothetical protein ADU72_1811 [Pediococcus damnosus]